MSPEPRDDDKDPREGPPAGREPERPRAKSAKTKQHEVPPHGDALMTRAAEKPPKPAKARSRTAGGGRDGAGEGAGGDGKAIAPARCGSATMRIAFCRRSATSTCTSSGKAPTAASRSDSARTCEPSTASRA